MERDQGGKVVGLLALLGLGGVLFLLYRRGLLFKGQLAAPPPTIYIINNGFAAPGTTATLLGAAAPIDAPLDRLDRVLSRVEQPMGNDILQSYELPAMGTATSAVRVCQALAQPFDVTLRVVGPAGSFASFAPSPNELDLTGTGTVPVGNTLIVPAGADHRLKLNPRQVLYAKGSVAGVIISVNATEAAVRGLL